MKNWQINKTLTYHHFKLTGFGILLRYLFPQHFILKIYHSTVS